MGDAKLLEWFEKAREEFPDGVTVAFKLGQDGIFYSSFGFSKGGEILRVTKSVPCEQIRSSRGRLLECVFDIALENATEESRLQRVNE